MLVASRTLDGLAKFSVLVGSFLSSSYLRGLMSVVDSVRDGAGVEHNGILLPESHQYSH